MKLPPGVAAAFYSSDHETVSYRPRLNVKYGPSRIVIVDSAAAQYFREFNIYPNPFNKQLIVRAKDLGENIQISLFSITGQLIYKELRSNLPINNIILPDLQDGIYLLNIYDGTTYFTRKVLKKQM